MELKLIVYAKEMIQWRFFVDEIGSEISHEIIHAKYY